MKKWAAHFKKGKESLEDDDRCGRPTTSTTEKNISHVHKVVMDVRRLTAGLPRSGKNIWKMKFFKVMEKSGNFVDGQENLERTWKVRKSQGI